MVEILTLKEMLTRAEETEQKWAKRVYIEDGYLILNIHYPYEIELSRINTHAKLLHWMIHLLEKNWVTTEVLYWMVERLCAHFNWDKSRIGEWA